jgi:hypothetical protein
MQSIGRLIFLFQFPPAPRKIDFHKIHWPISKKIRCLDEILIWAFLVYYL